MNIHNFFCMKYMYTFYKYMYSQKMILDILNNFQTNKGLKYICNFSTLKHTLKYMYF